jgi:hypothetical protein
MASFSAELQAELDAVHQMTQPELQQNQTIFQARNGISDIEAKFIEVKKYERITRRVVRIEATAASQECPICYQDVYMLATMRHAIVKTACGHLFCYSCLFSWLAKHKKSTCPYFRRNLDHPEGDDNDEDYKEDAAQIAHKALTLWRDGSKEDHWTPDPITRLMWGGSSRAKSGV